LQDVRVDGKVLTAVVMKIQDFWYVTPCRRRIVERHLARRYCLHLQLQAVQEA
jgi:hypothetical protein